MSRLIIDNRSTLPDVQALDLCTRVIEQGRISNDGKQYCYAMVFHVGESRQYAVWTTLNKASDRFVVIDHEVES